MDVDHVTQLTDFELLDQYENSIRAVCETMAKYIHVSGEQTVELSLFGVPLKLPARELKEHLNVQMLFFEKKIAEVQNRISKSEGKVG